MKPEGPRPGRTHGSLVSASRQQIQQRPGPPWLPCAKPTNGLENTPFQVCNHSPAPSHLSRAAPGSSKRDAVETLTVLSTPASLEWSASRQANHLSLRPGLNRPCLHQHSQLGRPPHYHRFLPNTHQNKMRHLG